MPYNPVSAGTSGSASENGVGKCEGVGGETEGGGLTEGGKKTHSSAGGASISSILAFDLPYSPRTEDGFEEEDAVGVDIVGGCYCLVAMTRDGRWKEERDQISQVVASGGAVLVCAFIRQKSENYLGRA